MISKKTKKSLIGTRAQVWNGTKFMTSGGLTKKNFTKNKHNRIVSLKKSKRMKKNKNNPLAQGGFLRKKGDKGFGPKNKDPLVIKGEKSKKTKKIKKSKTFFNKFLELF